MDWQDQGFVLAARRHGESDAILTVLTREHRRHLGIVKGGTGRRSARWSRSATPSPPTGTRA
jgi:DNA repair protein RecO (recombination protein O)